MNESAASRAVHEFGRPSDGPSPAASMHRGRRAGVNAVVGCAVAGVLWLGASDPAQAQTDPRMQTGPSVDQIQIAYLYPDSPALKPFEALVKENRVLEKVQRSMSFIKLPRPLLIRFAQCNDDNAWYDPDEHTVTLCYELVRHIQDIAPKGRRAGVTRQDAILGSVYFTLHHEIAHAVIDMLEWPVIGREEDGADMVAAYAILTLDKPLPERLVRGAAWMWGQEARRERPDKGDFADVHSLSYQRFFNLLCLAYGSDPSTFSFVKRDLPPDRAAGCVREFKRLEVSISKLCEGHADLGLLAELRQYFRKPRPNVVQGSAEAGVRSDGGHEPGNGSPGPGLREPGTPPMPSQTLKPKRSRP